MREDGALGRPSADRPDGRRAELLVDLHGRLAQRLADVRSTTPIRADAASPRADKRQTSATIAQVLGMVALLTTLFVVPAIPLGLAAVVLGIRLRRHRRATGQPTRPADTAIALGAAATVIATWLLVYLVRHDAFY